MVARIFFALALVSLALAQSDKPAKPIKVQVNEVIVPVTVTDDKGRFVSNLEAKDFKIFDQGKEQRIEFFSRDRNQPVVVGFLVDLSNNSRVHWKYYQDAAIELVLNLLPGDKKYSGYLISYANEPELQVNTTSELGQAGGEAEQDEAGRRLVAIRCHLHGVHAPAVGGGRAVRSAAGADRDRRRAR